MEPVLNLAGALIAFLCAILLYRGYRRSSARLLMWSAVCFFGWAIENVVLFIDRNVVPDIDLMLVRHFIGALAISCLVIGLILESE